MDTGAYATYPKSTLTRYSKNRNYRFGKYLRTKGYRRKMVNPLNQFTYKKTRLGKYIKTQMLATICTYTTRIVLLNGTTNYTFPSGNQYLNLATILTGSPEFISRYTQYSYYMLNGQQVKLTRRWFDPIGFSVDGFATYVDGLSMLSMNFYPNLSSTTVGQPVEDADSSWKVSPFIHGVQSHYQPFPKNFTTGSNSNGLGVWNAGSSYTSISGELAIYNDAGALAGNNDMAIWDLEINHYISFCNNTGT